MPKERDEILTKLRSLHDDFKGNYASSIRVYADEESPFVWGLIHAWMEACGRLGDLIEELDPDSALPIEDSLGWHRDFMGWFDATMDSRSRNMHRRCFQCSECKAGLEVEFPADKDKHRKRVRCKCGHVQLVVCFN